MCDFFVVCVCDLSVCVCAAEINACTDGLFCNTHSFAVCQPNKTCYVIQYFCASYKCCCVLSLLVLEDYDKERLFALKDPFSLASYCGKTALWEHRPCLFVPVWRCTTYNIRVGKASVTSFHPPSRFFFPTRGWLCPSTPHGAGSI